MNLCQRQGCAREYCVQAHGLPGVSACASAVDILKAVVDETRRSSDHSTFSRAAIALSHATQAQYKAATLLDADPRGHLAEMIKLLTEAHTMCAASVQQESLPDLPDNVQTPLQSCIADVLLRLAQLHLQHAQADAMWRQADVDASQPAFPRLGTSDASAVAAFLSDTLAAAHEELDEVHPAAVDHGQLAQLRASEAARIARGGVTAAQAELVVSRALALAWNSATEGTSIACWMAPPATAPPTTAAPPPDPASAGHASGSDKQADSEEEVAPAGDRGQEPTQAPADGVQTATSEKGSAVMQLPAQRVLTAAEEDWAQAQRRQGIASARKALQGLVELHRWSDAVVAAQLLASFQGESNPVKTTWALAIAQDCQAVLHLLQVMQEHLPQDSHEKFANSLASQPTSRATTLQANQAQSRYLKASAELAQAVRSDACSAAVENAVSKLPKNVCVVTLHRDEDGSDMLLSVVQHAGTAGPAPDGAAASALGAESSVVAATVKRAHVDAAVLRRVQDQFASWSTALLSAGAHQSPAAAEPGESLEAVGLPAAIEVEWKELLQALDTMLGPFSDTLKAAAADMQPVAEDAASKGKAAKGQPAAPAEAKPSIVLCLPSCIGNLPLEALQDLKNAGCITRDLSLFSLMRRAEAASTVGAKANLSSAVHQHSETLSTMFNASILSVYGQGWRGKPLSAGNQEGAEAHKQLLQGANALVVCSDERLAQCFAPRALCAADVSNMQLGIIFDNMLSTAAAQSQMRVAGNRPGLLEPDALGRLLLLRGAWCCVMSRFVTAPEAGVHACADVLAAAAGGMPVAGAVKSVGEKAESQQGCLPWVPYSMFTIGLPHLTAELEKGGKGKKK